jgi:hypothetical protein
MMTAIAVLHLLCPKKANRSAVIVMPVVELLVLIYTLLGNMRHYTHLSNLLYKGQKPEDQ